MVCFFNSSKAKRPALDQLLKDAHRGRFDAVAIWRLDRLARSVHHLVTVVRDLESLGVDLIVLDQGKTPVPQREDSCSTPWPP